MTACRYTSPYIALPLPVCTRFASWDCCDRRFQRVNSWWLRCGYLSTSQLGQSIPIKAAED